MIIRSLARRPGAIASFTQRACNAPYARYKHSVPVLANQPELNQNGIPGLLSKDGFDIAYTQYQSHIISSLNEMTSGTTHENTDVKSLIVNVARDPMAAPLFNYASMAFNNHFFFRGLNTDPNVKSQPSDTLLPLINKNFTSLDAFRETFLYTADAMFGPGFVWLVQTDEGTSGSLKILTTYLAGSPISGAHYRRQAVDMNTENTNTYAGSFGDRSRQRDQKPKRPLGGVDVTPLLCVNTWEHVYLHDYGVGGKLQYLEKWWAKINWNLAEQFVATPQAHQPRSAGQGARKFEFSR